MENVITFNMPKQYSVSSLTNQIQSLCFISVTKDDYPTKVLIGTRGCAIYEVDCPKTSDAVKRVTVITQGHHSDELWGLATHPCLTQYCTVGDDKTLRLWGVLSRRMIACIPIDTMARACCYHPTKDIIVVGFGGTVGRGKQKQDGLIRIYSFDNNYNENCNIKQLLELNVSKQWISDVKFSPDGNYLAIGSHDRTIYLFTVQCVGGAGRQVTQVTLNRGSKFSKHNASITHFDFSSDSRYLQSNCGAYELLFCDVTSGKHVTSASELKDVHWATWTCTLGWPVQGIWPAGADGTDINSVDRSHSGHLVATSDDFGKVRVLKYPCVDEGSPSLQCLGHSSNVMNVRWSSGDSHLISVGGNDKSIFQWRHKMVSNVEGMSSTVSNATSKSMGKKTVSIAHNDDESEELTKDEDYNSKASGGGEDEEPSGGDEFMAVKPWKGAIKPPPIVPPSNPLAPASSLSLQWVHGYTSASAGSCDARVSNNLFYNANYDVVYPAAALGVCLHVDSESYENSTQKYFKGHNDDILCLAMSPNRRYVATGQISSKSSKGKATICVWDAIECRLLSELKDCHQRGIISLSFSPDNEKLLSIGLDDSFEHILWVDKGGSWSRVQKMANSKSDKKTVILCMY
jgi:microtubule-associated protein-like 6